MFRVIIDSCGELTPEMKADDRFVGVPLTLTIDGKDIIDDETFDQKKFLKAVAKSKNAPKSACPSPQAYMDAFGEEADHIYVITLSSKLSGSYNSACIAREMFLEEMEDEDREVQVHVFDSKSASIGQTLIGLYAASCEEKGMSFEEVVNETEAYIEKQHTFFVLDTLETLRKAGRLGHVKEMLASALNIKAVMGSTPEGDIAHLGNGRGMPKALDVMVDKMIEASGDMSDRILAISHCNCPERAEMLRQKALQRGTFADVFILDTAGVSSMYANDGGVIMVV